MRALFDPDVDAIADEEDLAEFRRGFAAVGEDNRRILMILIPKLVALQERGDSATALSLIAEIKRIVTGGEGPLH
ncbi:MULTISPECIES: hypothetical protein [unclassified Caulobacter]|jgi:hypothetical protein|uniref:hypothetical protein n=1 Tax=unclassified Caulobacter TaxID=2648921 RepID=UPI0006485C05|nr:MULTISPECIES: hypothetical protein [unclassified Caulobacter]KQV62252.1 hypothetical protein ASC62_01555 [Caulobacter sp. Root342]KQV63172.1 hypothetical protein ASC70_22470 [Caulobacter sp. Root343]